MSEQKKRNYRRRSEDERIEALQAEIDSLREKIEAKKRKDMPVLKEIPKIQRRLQKFVQMAVDYERHDIANTTLAFLAGLERIHSEAQERRTCRPYTLIIGIRDTFVPLHAIFQRV